MILDDWPFFFLAFICMLVCTHAQDRPSFVLHLLGAGVRGGCESHSMGAVLEEQQMVFST